jgi:hypothetical protein
LQIVPERNDQGKLILIASMLPMLDARFANHPVIRGEADKTNARPLLPFTLTCQQPPPEAIRESWIRFSRLGQSRGAETNQNAPAAASESCRGIDVRRTFGSQIQLALRRGGFYHPLTFSKLRFFD